MNLLQKVSPYLGKIEVALLLMVGLGIWLNVSESAGGQEVLMVSMLILAAFYFFSAYLPPESNHFLATIGMKVIHISSSVCVIGIMFALLHLNGAREMLMIGGLSIGVAGILMVYFAITNWSPAYLALLLRIVFIGIFTANTFLSLRKISS